jgi:hypothetical protein
MAKLAIGTDAITFSKLPQNSRRDQAETITNRLQSGQGCPVPNCVGNFTMQGVVSKSTIWVPEARYYFRRAEVVIIRIVRFSSGRRTKL